MIDVDWLAVAALTHPDLLERPVTEAEPFTRAAVIMRRAVDAGADALRDCDTTGTDPANYHRQMARAVLAAALEVIFTDMDQLADREA